MCRVPYVDAEIYVYGVCGGSGLRPGWNVDGRVAKLLLSLRLCKQGRQERASAGARRVLVGQIAGDAVNFRVGGNTSTMKRWVL